MIFNRVAYNMFSAVVTFVLFWCWFWTCKSSWGIALLLWVAFWCFDMYMSYKCKQKRKARKLMKN